VPELDPCQSDAVSAGPVDVFVAAGAGSGKTRVLTSRFVAAVLGEEPYGPCDPRELLTVTFTEKAAGELAERIRRALNAAGDTAGARALGEAWILTIHGMCARILRQHAFEAGVDPYFRVLDQVEASALEAEALEDVVGEMLERDADVLALFDTYGYEAVVTSALRIRDSARSLGVGIAGIRTAEPELVRGRLHDSAAELTRLVGEFAHLPRMKTVEANQATARAAAALIADGAQQDTAELECLLGTLTTRGTRHLSSVEGLNELVDATVAAIEGARASVAQLLVGAHERAFLGLASALDSRCAQLKAERGMLDFTDLELRTLELLESCPDVAAGYRSRFAMLMLDEFQDTNALQASIIEALSSTNLCTVGDENQSIYGFRHADVAVFRERAARVADRRQLDINYRTSPALLAALNALFGHPSLLGAGYMPLRSPEARGTDPALWHGLSRFEARFIDWGEAQGADPQENEAVCIAQRVAEFIAAGVQPADIAVLMRALAGGRGSKVERALTSRGIPAYLASGGAFFECSEIVEARALLRAIDNVRDDAAVTVVLAGRLGGLSPDSLVTIRAHADTIAAERGHRRSEAHLWDALAGELPSLPGADAIMARRVADVIEAARDKRGIQPLADTVIGPMIALDADLAMFAAGTDGARAWSNVLKLAHLADEYETATGGDLAGFLEFLEMREIHGKSEQEATLDGELDAVRIMSIHAAKGLEFPVVVVAGLTGGRDVPGIAMARIDGAPLLGMTLPTAAGTVGTVASEDVRAAVRLAADAEAVRLLYVACTRAEEALTIVARTQPLKEADDTLGDRVRRALGLQEAGALLAPAAEASAAVPRVTLVPPPIPATAPAARAEPVAPVGDEGPIDVAVSAASAGPVTPEPRVEVPRQFGVPRWVSYTGLATYERCPYRFFLTSIAGLPAPPAAQGGDALAFGSAVHAALERVRSSGDDIQAAIDAAVVSSGLALSSVPRLKKAVEAYVSSAVASEIFSARRSMFEAPIAVPVAGTVLAGAIDAIAWQDDRALVVDYKTGTAPLTALEAEARYRLQGECYALAAFGAGATEVRVAFAELERERVTSYAYGSADRERIQASVTEIVDRMADGEYGASAVYEREQCETCPGLGAMCSVRRPAGGAAE